MCACSHGMDCFPYSLSLSLTFRSFCFIAAIWQERLDALEISKHSLSAQGCRALETLALTAIRLGINDSSVGR